MTNILKEATRKALVNQTSEQLFKKLTDSKLFGVSKEIAITILSERKAKGKFNGDLSAFKTDLKKEAIEKKVKEEDTKEQKKTVEHVSKLTQRFPGFELTFKKGQKVKFTPFRTITKLEGVITGSHAHKPKNGALREDVHIKVGNKKYIKKGSEVTVIK